MQILRQLLESWKFKYKYSHFWQFNVYKYRNSASKKCEFPPDTHNHMVEPVYKWMLRQNSSGCRGKIPLFIDTIFRGKSVIGCTYLTFRFCPYHTLQKTQQLCQGATKVVVLLSRTWVKSLRTSECLQHSLVRRTSGFQNFVVNKFYRTFSICIWTTH